MQYIRISTHISWKAVHGTRQACSKASEANWWFHPQYWEDEGCQLDPEVQGTTSNNLTWWFGCHNCQSVQRGAVSHSTQSQCQALITRMSHVTLVTLVMPGMSTVLHPSSHQPPLLIVLLAAVLLPLALASLLFLSLLLAADCDGWAQLPHAAHSSPSRLPHAHLWLRGLWAIPLLQPTVPPWPCSPW